MRRVISIALFVALATACSEEGSGGGDPGTGAAGASGANGGSAGSPAGGASTGGAAAGGMSGNAGSGGAATRGAVSLDIRAPTGCALPAQFLDAPSIASGHPVTATSKTQALENGETTSAGELATVLCTWIGTTSIQLDAVITLQTGGSRRSVNLGAYPLVVGQPAQGGLVLSGGPTGPYGARIDTCTYTPIEVDPITRSVWGEVRCPAIENRDDGSICEVGPSYYFFENCVPP